ncbi:MAG: hypothetical protein R3E67_06105 [Pseudomonadales bacterium]
MALDSSYEFSRDASVEILTAGLLGEQYIGVTQGGAEVLARRKVYLGVFCLVLEQLIGKFMTSMARNRQFNWNIEYNNQCTSVLE